METISNVANTVTNTVTKTIWGEQNLTQGNETAGQEPISGQQGKGTVDDPYDQGNEESRNTPEHPKIKTDNPTSSDARNDSPIETTHKASALSSTPNNPHSAAEGGAPDPLRDTENTGVKGNLSQSIGGSSGIGSESQPNPGAAPSSGAQPSQKHQGANRPSDAPTGDEESAIKEKKDDAEEVLKKRDPNDHSGEPMRMHDGPGSVPSTQEERRNSTVGNPGGQEHGKPEKGTGEKWVKSSGLHADGGDFDATKPGAGREADRLLEQRGIKKGDAGQMLSSDDDTPVTTAASNGSGEKDHKEKVSLGEKLKTKLHIGHNK